MRGPVEKLALLLKLPKVAINRKLKRLLTYTRVKQIYKGLILSVQFDLSNNYNINKLIY